ncbi:hypothetical protein DSS3PM1_00102 [Bacteriophage DSS3_PM1]|uniref:Uncharacterized protein n=1 Tax=Bacteriophage DSS3_VP1 TaxID=2664196 RepID=A0A7S5FXE4_9CAUD|nr:hypothetical protein KNU84_gp066 [Bacteriophage DSS3_VP1]QGH74638.1 hypothetical protein DSS3VP1_00070 [Bacteriophage DSS3_VP1]QGH74778.1 hypothetical protein DSS3PM1_00102 [Bacteriophage DSS3_PM1]
MTVRVLQTKEGNPLRVTVDERNRMIQFVQFNDEVFDEVHMHITTFAAICKAFNVDEAELDKLYTLEPVWPEGEL